jgi:anti-sigma factor RsiW
MHAVVIESLEEYLAGTLEPVERKAIEAHLSHCSMCLEEISGMQDVSSLFSALRVEEPVAPAPGFYARVMQDVEARKRPSFTGVFDLGFARRMAFASLLTITVLGGFLISRDHSYRPGYTPDSVMAQQNLPSFDNSSPDNMLVTLTNYER